MAVKLMILEVEYPPHEKRSTLAIDPRDVKSVGPPGDEFEGCVFEVKARVPHNLLSCPGYTPLELKRLVDLSLAGVGYEYPQATIPAGR